MISLDARSLGRLVISYLTKLFIRRVLCCMHVALIIPPADELKAVRGKILLCPKHL